MFNLHQAISAVLTMIGRRWRELARFTLLFRILESFLCAPFAALVGKLLLGRTVLDSTALISFLLSVRGVISVLLGATAVVAIRFIEHAGLAVIFFGGLDGRTVSARQAVQVIGRCWLELLRASARFVALGLLTFLPLLAVAGAFAMRLLGRHDINYYLKLRPPDFIRAAVVIGLVAFATLAMLVGLVVRWRWVVQAVLFEKKTAREAFERSADLTAGLRGKLTGLVIGVTVFSLLLGMIASFLGTAGASLLVGMIGQNVTLLGFVFGALLLLRTLVGVACTFLGSCIDAGIFTALYRRRVEAVGGHASLETLGDATEIISGKWLITGFAVSLLVFAGTATFLALDALSSERAVTIHAHRGVWTDAPENTLAAVRGAIAARADYIETDVQLSRDDVLVIAHDSDFSRLGGVAKKVWELTYEEIRAIPLGGRSAPEFRNEITPTLDALLDQARGHIKVNIELKYYGNHQPGLARKVVEAVRARGMVNDVVIQSLEYEPLLEVRQLAPEILVGYLLSFNAREPSKLSVDFLSVEKSRLNRGFLAQAHQKGLRVYAWTVNTEKDLQQQLDLGVDAVITDQSAIARRIVDEYLQRPKLERAVRQVQAWLAE